MCTVSYLPLKSGGYILTSNRDEAPRRNAVDIQRIQVENHTLLFPKDPEAGGSWFCVSDQHRAACLLNGAYIPYIAGAHFTHSRGKVLLDVMSITDINLFAEEYDLTSTAPFTLVLIDNTELHELIWDGESVVTRTLDPGTPAFWSSVTLYPEDVRVWRRSLFQQWLAAQEQFTQDAIMQFHRYGSSEDGWNGFVMNRQERVKTLSITSVQKSDHRFTLQHTDLAHGSTFIETLDFNSAHVAQA